MSLNTKSNFMMIVAIVFFIYSALWALAPFSSINLPARLILDNLATPLDRNTQWLSAIAAGVLAAVSVFLGGIVAPAIKEGNVAVTRTTIIAMVIWYVIDGSGSVAAGVASNVFFNSIYLVLVLIPLIGIRNAKQS